MLNPEMIDRKFYIKKKPYWIKRKYKNTDKKIQEVILAENKGKVFTSSLFLLLEENDFLLFSFDIRKGKYKKDYYILALTKDETKYRLIPDIPNKEYWISYISETLKKVKGKIKNEKK